MRVLAGPEGDGGAFAAELEALEQVPDRLAEAIMAEGVEFDLGDEPAAELCGLLADAGRHRRRRILLAVEGGVQQLNQLHGGDGGGGFAVAVAMQEGDEAARHPPGVGQVQREVEMRRRLHAPLEDAGPRRRANQEKRGR